MRVYADNKVSFWRSSLLIVDETTVYSPITLSFKFNRFERRLLGVSRIKVFDLLSGRGVLDNSSELGFCEGWTIVDG